jgi:hypothetical protein
MAFWSEPTDFPPSATLMVLLATGILALALFLASYFIGGLSHAAPQ